MDKIKVLFMGTPDFCVPVLEGLIENYDVIGVVTQPDKEVGRNHEIKFSPIKEVALKNNIKVYQPIKIKQDYNFVLEIAPDIIVTCAYGQIVPLEVLNFPKYGCINVHASLLPKYRGGAPIHRSIIDGESKTGITIMYMDEHMDTGNIISSKEILIDINDNVGTLHDKLSILGKELLLETLPSIIAGTNESIKQDDSCASYAPTIKREDELIDFSKSAINVYNQIRGLNPFPVAYAVLDGKIIKVYNSIIKENSYSNKKTGEIVKLYDNGIGICVSDKEIILTEIKPEGKRKMAAKDYLNGIDSKSLIGKVFNEE